MKRILNYLNDLQLDEKTQLIINGNQAQNVVQQRLQEIQILEQMDRVLYMSKLNERIKQITKPCKALSVLVLVDQLMKRGLLSCLPHMEFRSLQEKMQVKEVLLTIIFKYYHYFLQMNNCSHYNRYTLNEENELYEAEYYCKISILKIIEFLKIEFVFIHGWTKLIQYRLLLREIIQSILQRFAEDLTVLTLFVENNQETILQKTVAHPLLFQIYHIYQKLIFINKNMSKLEKLGRLGHCEQQFPTYEINLELNKEIQLAVLERREQNKLLPQNGHGFAKRIEQAECFDEQAVKTTESFLLLNDFEQYS